MLVYRLGDVCVALLLTCLLADVLMYFLFVSTLAKSASALSRPNLPGSGQGGVTRFRVSGSGIEDLGFRF